MISMALDVQLGAIRALEAGEWMRARRSVLVVHIPLERGSPTSGRVDHTGTLCS
jgi:hypothetical protein